MKPDAIKQLLDDPVAYNNKRKPFCDNPVCPHNKLDHINIEDGFPEDHYHSGDEGVVSTVAGILRRHRYEIVQEHYERKRRFVFIYINEAVVTKKDVYFCDVCNEAVKMMSKTGVKW